ncbi:MAG: DUF1566 domain-containing protein [Bacteroidetes bacterium]|nr:DUF1566 domain-containing protein [Bacteroidota bacterium]
MKRIFIIVVGLMLTISVFAQSPEKMSYQAVIRDLSNNLVTNHAVGIKISILQGSIYGTAVYEEICYPNSSTNANGLVTLEIGAGIPITGAFASINWANDIYFIKTETDPTGGTNYTITGVSQLLSVPYALHAKTAENVTNIPDLSNFDQDVTDDFDGQYSSLTDAPINVSDFTNDAGYITTFTEIDGDVTNEIQDLDLTGNILTITENGSATTVDLSVYLDNTDTQLTETEVDVFADNNGYLETEVDGSVTNEIELPTTAKAGDMCYWNGGWVVVAATANEGATLQMIGGIPTWTGGTQPTLAVGVTYGGGIIFYILQDGDLGYVAGETHGLIAAPSDQSTNIQWDNGTHITTGATAITLGTGNANTNTIVASQGAGSYAAQLCADLSLGGFADWYLPSKDELQKLYINKVILGCSASSVYWSSTEINNVQACEEAFEFGTQSNGFKSHNNNVRAVRTF